MKHPPDPQLTESSIQALKLILFPQKKENKMKLIRNRIWYYCPIWLKLAVIRIKYNSGPQELKWRGDV